MCQEPFRGAWRGAGSSDFFDLTRLCGSTNESDKQTRTPNQLVRSCRPLIQHRPSPKQSNHSTGDSQLQPRLCVSVGD